MTSYRQKLARFIQSEILSRAPDAVRTGAAAVRKWARTNGTEPARSDLTVAEWVSVCEASNYRCAYCSHDGRMYQLGMEHIVPLSRSGDHSIENVALVCLNCNVQKKQLTLLEFVCVEMDIMRAGRGRAATTLQPGEWGRNSHNYREYNFAA